MHAACTPAWWLIQACDPCVSRWFWTCSSDTESKGEDFAAEVGLETDRASARSGDNAGGRCGAALQQGTPRGPEGDDICDDRCGARGRSCGPTDHVGEALGGLRMRLRRAQGLPAVEGARGRQRGQQQQARGDAGPRTSTISSRTLTREVRGRTGPRRFEDRRDPEGGASQPSGATARATRRSRRGQ